jgi:cob(I)alamin adenosyltransferase
LHLCRTSCRTVERHLFSLIEEGKADENVGKFINRLSDYFFVLSRVIAKKGDHKETIYVAEKKKKFLEEKKSKE